MITDSVRKKILSEIRRKKKQGLYEHKIVTLPQSHFEKLSDEELFILIETPNLQIVIDDPTARYICDRAEAMGIGAPKVKSVNVN